MRAAAACIVCLRCTASRTGSTSRCSPFRPRLFGLGDRLDLPDRLGWLLDVRAGPEPARFRLRRILAVLFLRDVQCVHKRLCRQTAKQAIQAGRAPGSKET